MKRTSQVTSPRHPSITAGIWSFACLIALAGASLFAFGTPARAAESLSRATNLVHPGNPEFARGHILVGSFAGAPDAEVEQVLEAHGGRSLGKLNGLNVHVMEVPQGLELDTAAKLAHNPHVRFAEVDQLVTPAVTANDPYFAQEWHLTKIGAPTAWGTSTGKGVIIAILDSGVDGTVPDLAAQMVPGWNFYDNNSNTADVTGHGTVVAGAAAAVTNNATGVASVAGGAKIMPIRISDTSGNALWSSVASAITWAADHGAKVVNFSYSGISANSSTIQTAASYLRSKGGTLYVAAGNTGTQDTQSATSGVITVVSATDQNDNLASFSTYGGFVDIAAPGVNIISTQKGGGYCMCGGTSLATPIVAATAALILARRPDFGAAQVDATLKASATDLGPAGTDIYFGAGRVNAAAAVALAGSTSVDTTPPTVSIAFPTSGTVSGIVPVSVNAADNVGVTKVDLRVNGATVASDTLAPYQFSWDSTKVANGSVTLSAVAYDAAGNSKVSTGVALTVSNAAAPVIPAPTIKISNPTSGAKVSGKVDVTTTASDTSGTSGILQSLYIDGTLVASGNGGTMTYRWNTTRVKPGSHTIKAVATLSGKSATAQETVTK